jgi:hypothetical protein
MTLLPLVFDKLTSVVHGAQALPWQDPSWPFASGPKRVVCMCVCTVPNTCY